LKAFLEALNKWVSISNGELFIFTSSAKILIPVLSTESFPDNLTEESPSLILHNAARACNVEDITVDGWKIKC